MSNLPNCFCAGAKPCRCPVGSFDTAVENIAIVANASGPQTQLTRGDESTAPLPLRTRSRRASYSKRFHGVVLADGKRGGVAALQTDESRATRRKSWVIAENAFVRASRSWNCWS